MKTIPIYRWVGGSTWGPTTKFAMVGHAKVDDWWYDRLIAMGRWMERKKKKGVRQARLQGDSKLGMHQVVGGKGWDHVNGDGLDNRESNLRPATLSQQAANRSLKINSTSGEPGVSWNKSAGKWLVRVRKERELVFRKYFSDFNEAVQVARLKRKEIHGEFVRQ